MCLHLILNGTMTIGKMGYRSSKTTIYILQYSKYNYNKIHSHAFITFLSRSPTNSLGMKQPTLTIIDALKGAENEVELCIMKIRSSFISIQIDEEAAQFSLQIQINAPRILSSSIHCGVCCTETQISFQCSKVERQSQLTEYRDLCLSTRLYYTIYFNNDSRNNHSY